MKRMTKALIVSSLTAAWLLSLPTGASAVVVDPTVTNSTAVAITAGSVPLEPTNFLFDSLPLQMFGLDVQVEDASASATASNVPPGGAETADGAAEVDLDLAIINNSAFRSRSKVTTEDSPPAATQSIFRMANGSVAAMSTTLSTVGLAPGETATVDLALNVTGSLIYTDPTGAATTGLLEDPFDPQFNEQVPDMSASVSLVFALADPILILDPSQIPDPLPFATLFNGSLTLESIPGGGAPLLVGEGDWAGLIGVQQGPCDQFFCQVDVATQVLFPDVQSLGFGETFETGLVLLTSADAISDQDGAGLGRMSESNFFDTVLLDPTSFDVTLTVDPALAPATEPGTMLLMVLGLGALGWRRRLFLRD